MFNFEEFSINENLNSKNGNFILIDSPEGKFYIHNKFYEIYKENSYSLLNQFFNHNKIKDNKIEYVNTYKINPNGKITVHGNVNFHENKMSSIPFMFEDVIGSFDISASEIESLEGCPAYIFDDFDCGNCKKLTSLNYCPSYIEGSFNIQGCENIKSLKYFPKKINGLFNCSYCDLKSFEGIPESFEEISYVDASYNVNLKSLKGLPKKINYSLYLSNCMSLQIFKDGTKVIGQNLDITSTGIKSFEDLPQVDKIFFSKILPDVFYLDDITSPILNKIHFDNKLPTALKELMKLLKQHNHLKNIVRYDLFVNAVISINPEFKSYYKAIPKVSSEDNDLLTFL